MNRALYLIILLLVLSLSSRVNAQNNEHNQILEQAEEDYQIGRFDQILTVLNENLNSFQGNNKQKALRLIALCYLAKDDEKKAEEYARQLITLNNYYSNVDDPIRFEEMVNKLKVGYNYTITTASSVSEDINETPGPMTIITSEMIENLGSNKNLNQILATYVPGMTEIESDYGDNMAMHGAYAQEQELILVMENGHRLNSRSGNDFKMSYGISTEKIDHIEVLRGPASSLYGNVALSAVVNIITKTGGNINGVKAKASYGSFNTMKAEITAGTRFMDADIFAWASFYQSDGQSRTIRDSAEYRQAFNIPPDPNQHAHVDAYRDNPSYDIGMTLKLRDFDMMFSKKSNKKVPQYTSIYGYYDYDRYRVFNGVKPGVSTESTHFELGYKHQFNQAYLSLSIYGDWYTTNDYTCLGGESEENEKKPMEDREYLYGMFDLTYLREQTIGGNVRAGTDYKLGSMNGSILAGCQYEHFTMGDLYNLTGEKYDSIYSVTLPNFVNINGKENSLSFYIQDKHHFLPYLILNIGARYDIKYHIDNSKATAFSPRLALIYAPNKSFSTKLTFSKSFVDMPFSYRVLKYVDDDNNYLPQYLTALQYSILGNIPSLHLHYDVNLFYNKYDNLYTAVVGQLYENKKWRNKGHYENLGIEGSATYSHKRLYGVLTCYWSKVLKVDSYYYSDEYGRVIAVPNLTANLNLAWKLVDNKKHQLKIYLNTYFQNSKLLTSEEFMEDGWTVNTTKLDAQCIFDTGVKYTYNNCLQLSFDCENILNSDRFVVGPSINLYPYYQRGRTIMGTLSVQF